MAQNGFRVQTDHFGARVKMGLGQSPPLFSPKENRVKNEKSERCLINKIM